MGEVLKVLLVESIEAEASRTAEELSKAGFQVEWTHVGSEAALRAAADPSLDLVLCDGAPGSLGLGVVRGILDDAAPDVPIIVVSDTLDEERIVDAMRCGAKDYVLTSRLESLGPAVERVVAVSRRRDDAERRLRRGEAALSLALDQLPAVVWTLDEDLRFTRSAGAGLRSLGLTPDEVVGRTLEDYLGGLPEGAVALDACRQALAGEVVRFEVDWGGRLFEAVVQPLHKERGRSGVAGVALDVTDRRAVIERVIAAQRLESVGRLAGGIAHDFNNALTVISNYTGFLLEQFRGHPEVYEDLAVVREAAERASRLTHQLLAFSKRQVLEPEPLDVNDVVVEVERLLRQLLGEDVDLVIALDPGVGPILADWTQLQHVLLNLAIHARDAMPHGGRFAIESDVLEVPAAGLRGATALPSGRYTRLRLSDSGERLTPDGIEEVFEPFSSVRGGDQGTGLGLATAYGIVRQSGGHIWVESSEGSGVTFTIAFPELDLAVVG